MFYAGLDVGGTSGRVRFLKEDGSLIGDYIGNGCAFNTDGEEIGREKYTTLMKDALAAYSLEIVDCGGICVAASGIDSVRHEQACRRIFMDLGIASERLMIVNDCELFLYLLQEPSLVVISGTGSICFGRNKNGAVVRTGGWNYLLSDEGSAYDIGLMTLKAAAEYLDGRNSADEIFSYVKDELKVETLEDMDCFVNEQLMDKSKIGKLSLGCAMAASRGDETACSILRSSADKIFALIRDTYQKMKMDDSEQITVWLWGSVLVKNEMVRGYLEKQIKENLPNLTTAIPQKTALEIAADCSLQFRTDLRIH